VDAETRDDLDRTLGAFRDDVRHEIGTLREEGGTLSQDVGSLRGDFGALRQEVRDSAADARRHFDVAAEDIRHDVRGLAEGVIALSARVDRMGTDIRDEMNERFKAAHAVVRVAFQEVRRDIGDLSARL